MNRVLVEGDILCKLSLRVANVGIDTADYGLFSKFGRQGYRRGPGTQPGTQRTAKYHAKVSRDGGLAQARDREAERRHSQGNPEVEAGS